MKKIFLAVTLFTAVATSGFAQINLKKAADKATKVLTDGGLNTPLSNEEVGKGLKEALNKGATQAVENLSVTDGYYKSALYKIMIPQDMQTVVGKVSKVPGFQNVETQIIEKMNRAAEKAASKATPIFVKAITSLSFTDAMNILMGEKNAATTYLNKTTSDALYKEFSPIIASALSEVGATKYWGDAVGTYNKIPMVKKSNPDLTDYVTREALKGLFGKVAEKELDIRQNPTARGSDILKKVFAKQDKK